MRSTSLSFIDLKIREASHMVNRPNNNAWHLSGNVRVFVGVHIAMNINILLTFYVIFVDTMYTEMGTCKCC